MQILFRLTRENRYTIPLLLNLAEAWDRKSRVHLGVLNTMEEALRALATGGPTLLGYSFMTPKMEAVAREIEAIRDHLGPRDLLVAGGPHPTADPQGTLAMGFGAVVVGEAEAIFPRLLEAWAKGRHSCNFPPLWRTRAAAPLEKGLPISERLSVTAPLELSRGCLYACGYCFTPRMFSKPPRHRTMASIAHYLTLSRRMGREVAKFIAPDAFSYRDPEICRSVRDSLEAVLRLCHEHGMSQIHLGIFPSEVRPDRVQDVFLELVLTYCANRKLVIGAQSGSDGVLRSIGRGHTVRAVERAVERVVAAGLMAHVDVIFGLPGETAEDRLDTLRLMERLLRMGRTKIHGHMYLPLPGTPLFPLPPSELEPWFLDRVRQLRDHGALDGEWELQAALQERILGWRQRGLIRV